MIKDYTTLMIDMYGVIIKESKGNFIPYTYSHFDECHYERIERLLKEEKLFEKAQMGEISSDEFLSRLGYENPQFTMKDYIDNYLTLDEGFIRFAEGVKGKYDLVLVSNDLPQWSSYITQKYDLDKYFSHKIISGDIGARKPDFKIFDTALEIIKKTPRECIFVDNSAKNLVAAEEVGLSPILFNRDNEHYYGMEVFNFDELCLMMGIESKSHTKEKIKQEGNL